MNWAGVGLGRFWYLAATLAALPDSAPTFGDTLVTDCNHDSSEFCSIEFAYKINRVDPNRQITTRTCFSILFHCPALEVSLVVRSVFSSFCPASSISRMEWLNSTCWCRARTSGPLACPPPERDGRAWELRGLVGGLEVGSSARSGRNAVHREKRSRTRQRAGLAREMLVSLSALLAVKQCSVGG